MVDKIISTEDVHILIIKMDLAKVTPLRILISGYYPGLSGVANVTIKILIRRRWRQASMNQKKKYYNRRSQTETFEDATPLALNV